MIKFISLIFIGLLNVAVFAGSPPQNFPAVKGIVRSIDLVNQQITLKHERIPNLDMPGMTMPFTVENTQLLEGIKVGDQVVFAADMNTNGDMIIIWMEKNQLVPPNNLPQVKGVIKKIDLVNQKITLKHERIPNLDMPGMIMPFHVQNVQILDGFKVGDQIVFSAEQDSNGELVVVWMSQSQVMPITDQSSILCTGLAKTTPKTNIEVEIRQNKYSTVRYEIVEGAYKGTAYINSIGRMILKKEGHQYYYYAGEGKLDSKLSFEKNGTDIQNAKLYHVNSGYDFEPISCVYQN